MANKLKISEKDSWWVIVLKAIVYIIGLILGGLGAYTAVNMITNV